MGNQPVVRILGLVALDQHELREAVAGDVSFEPEAAGERPGAAHEPLTTVAIIVLTATALKGIAAWLLKKRHHGEVEFEAETVRPDGTSERRRVRIDLSESSSDRDVVSEVGKQLSVDPKLITQALQLTAE